VDTARRISAETKAKANRHRRAGRLIERNQCMIERAMNPKPNARPSCRPFPNLRPSRTSSEAHQNARFRELLLLSAWCSLRYGEVPELRRKDFDADCSIVTVSRAVTHRLSGDGSRCRIDRSKTASPPMPSFLPHIRCAPKPTCRNHVHKSGRRVDPPQYSTETSGYVLES
jgi:hypothetical protein